MIFLYKLSCECSWVSIFVADRGRNSSKSQLSYLYGTVIFVVQSCIFVKNFSTGFSHLSTRNKMSIFQKYFSSQWEGSLRCYVLTNPDFLHPILKLLGINNYARDLLDFLDYPPISLLLTFPPYLEFLRKLLMDERYHLHVRIIHFVSSVPMIEFSLSMGYKQPEKIVKVMRIIELLQQWFMGC